MAVTTAISATGSALSAQSWVKDYTRSVHTQAKINTHLVQPWYKGYQSKVQSWSKLNNLKLKGAIRMYNHGIKRV